MSKSASIQSLWLELKQHLEQRYRALYDEVRHYPTPIAHCDDQLPGLIKQRSHAREQLLRMGTAAQPSLEFIRAYVTASPSTRDDTEADILARLKAALGLPPLSKGADGAQPRRGIAPVGVNITRIIKSPRSAASRGRVGPL